MRLPRLNGRRLARRTAALRYRHIVLPLLGRDETEHALDLACRLAADRGARVVLVAPLVIAEELPLDAHFDLACLRDSLDHAAAIADSYGVGVRRVIVRTREGALGEEVAEIADDHRAELVVVGAPVESRRGFRRPFSPEILSIVRESPCRVMISTWGNRVQRWPGVAGSKVSSAS